MLKIVTETKKCKEVSAIDYQNKSIKNTLD
jgi:hypothetical protein